MNGYAIFATQTETFTAVARITDADDFLNASVETFYDIFSDQIPDGAKLIQVWVK